MDSGLTLSTGQVKSEHDDSRALMVCQLLLSCQHAFHNTTSLGHFLHMLQAPEAVLRKRL